MDNLWILYWLTRLDAIIDTVSFIQLCLILASTAGALVWTLVATSSLRLSEEEECFLKSVKRWGIFFLVSLLLVSVIKPLIPTKNDAYVIVAGVAVTEAIKSESAKRIASKSVGVIEAWLNKQEKDLKKEKEE